MLNRLGIDTEVIDVELIEDCGVWKSSDGDSKDGVVRGDAILVRQSSMSPVALECAIDDDSNGSIAFDRFNLGVSLRQS